jgi:hypothetical protein
MFIFNMFRSAVDCAGRFIGEAYCGACEKISERIEQASDAIAEGRHQAIYIKKKHGAKQQVVDFTKVQIINGHKHLD